MEKVIKMEEELVPGEQVDIGHEDYRGYTVDGLTWYFMQLKNKIKFSANSKVITVISPVGIRRLGMLDYLGKYGGYQIRFDFGDKR